MRLGEQLPEGTLSLQNLEVKLPSLILAESIVIGHIYIST